MARLGRGYPVQPRSVKPFGAPAVVAAATLAALAWSGLPATATVGQVATATPASLAWTGLPATSSQPVTAPVAVGTLAWSGLPAEAAQASVIPATAASLAWTGLPAAAVSGLAGAANPGSVTWSGLPAAATAETGAVATPGSTAWTGLPADSSFGALTSATALPASLTWSGLPALAGVDVNLEAWTVGDTGQPVIQFADDIAMLSVEPVLADPPGGVDELVIRTQVHDMPALTQGPDGRYPAIDPTYTISRGVAGVLHTIVDGVDRTYFRGLPTIVTDFGFMEPGGEEDAAIEFPGITPFEKNGEPDSLSWLGHDREVELVLVDEGGTRHSLWSGLLTRDVSDITGDGYSTAWEAEGLLFTQAKNAPHRVRSYMPPVDVGWVVADELNSIPNRRFNAVERVTTGILTRDRGAGTFWVWDYVKKLLATAQDLDGRQWTVARFGPKDYRLVVKHTEVDYTVTAGAPGVELSGMTRDRDEGPNVFYGHGYTPNGFPWRGMRYIAPLLEPAPAFPNGGGTPIAEGDTDADTTSGDGVSKLEWRLFYIGYGVAVDGVLSASDVATITRLQTDFDLTVTGTVTPETWAAVFEVGDDADNFDEGSYRAPLAQDPRTDKYRRAPNGAILGIRAEWDPKVKIVAVDIDCGADITLGQASTSLRAQLARDSSGSLTGDMTLKSDPVGGPRIFASSGVNIRLKNYRGGDFTHDFDDWVLRASSVRIRPFDEHVPTTFTVDSKARDAMTLASILERDRASTADPARRPGAVDRRSRQSADITDQFDGEAGGGLVPEHFVSGGRWNVIPVPVEQVNRFTQVEYRCTARFAVVFLASRAFESQLTALCPNPLAVKDWAKDERWDDLGFIQSWGMLDDAAGFSPGQQSQGDPFTGLLLDTGGVEFYLERSPWMWIGEFTETDAHTSATLVPARNNS